MSVTTRRLLARISIAVDMCLLVALVIGTGVQDHPRWSAAFVGVAFCLVSIGCGLGYLRSTRSRP